MTRHNLDVKRLDELNRARLFFYPLAKITSQNLNDDPTSAYHLVRLTVGGWTDRVLIGKKKCPCLETAINVSIDVLFTSYEMEHNLKPFFLKQLDDADYFKITGREKFYPVPRKTYIPVHERIGTTPEENKEILRRYNEKMARKNVDLKKNVSSYMDQENC